MHFFGAKTETAALILPQLFLYVSTCGNYTWHKWPENLVLFSADSGQNFCRTSHNSTCLLLCEAIIKFIQSLMVLSSLQACNFYIHYTLLSSKTAPRLYIISNITALRRLYVFSYWLTSQYSIKTLLSNLKPSVVQSKILSDFKMYFKKHRVFF